MAQLLAYLLRIAPGLAITAVMFALLPRTLAGARLCVHLALFVLVRDAMTPIGLWQIADRPVFWLRFTRDPSVLLLLSLGSAGLLLFAWLVERALAARVVWLRGSLIAAVAAGIAAAALIAAPVVCSSLGTPAAARGGAVAARELAPLLMFSLVGNCYEELLFRGFLQGLWAERIGEARAALASGVAFAFGHLSLAITVTDVGAAILIFTAYEGLICAQLRRRMGLLAAVLAHGGGIFLLVSGLP